MGDLGLPPVNVLLVEVDVTEFLGEFMVGFLWRKFRDAYP